MSEGSSFFAKFNPLFGKIKSILRKSIVPLLIISPIASLAALLLAEKMVRYVSPQLTYEQAVNVSLRTADASEYLPSDLIPNLSTVHVGNTFEFTYDVKINSLGYRMEEFTIEKPKDVFRILMLGDSMTFGYGVNVEDNIPSRLEKALDEYLKKNGVGDKKIQIINAGFADGKSPDSYYLYLKNDGLKLEPDLIIANYFLNNDISDLDDTEWEKVDDEGLPTKIVSKTTFLDNGRVRFNRKYRNWKFAFPILKNSHLWIMFATALESKSPKAAEKIKNLAGVGPLPLVTVEENDECLLKNNCSQRMGELYGEFIKLVAATNELAFENNVEFLATLLPANPQVTLLGNKIKAEGILVDDADRLETAKLLAAKLASEFPQRRIRQELLGYQITIIDPLPYMVSERYEKYYFEKDGHPTVSGYERLAQSLYDFLTIEWGLLERI